MRKSFAIIACLLMITIAARAEQPWHWFTPSGNCTSCHNQLHTASGQEVSIGHDWRPSMMANSARDPYWLATVRREMRLHSTARQAVENECSRCHLPAHHHSLVLAGASPRLLEPLQQNHPLARDGVGCTVCHQIRPDKYGARSSFTGHIALDAASGPEQRQVYGPFRVGQGLEKVMRSASAFLPHEASHLSRSEMCATCHTLFTHALDEDGNVIGELPEQVPYLEWKASSYRDNTSCQQCHMPAADGLAPLASVLSKPRKGFRRHVFLGGNIVVPLMIANGLLPVELGHLVRDLERSAERNHTHLGERTADLRIIDLRRQDGKLGFSVLVRNLAGHKFPTAYPSRRAWLHILVLDLQGRVVFASGAVDETGAIAGNDNDAVPDRCEPHHRVIKSQEQVQIYESVLADGNGKVTTSLLAGVCYLKDNRLLPAGADKAALEDAVKVQGGAASDDDFSGGGDSVRVILPKAASATAAQIEVELLFQTISFRWAENFRPRADEAAERFLQGFERVRRRGHVVVARATAKVPAE